LRPNKKYTDKLRKTRRAFVRLFLVGVFQLVGTVARAKWDVKKVKKLQRLAEGNASRFGSFPV
jgi:hypothetical protein